ncbi:MAG: GSU2403 family nucleotidyltransferase fold protein, partial [Caldimonas sp.]
MAAPVSFLFQAHELAFRTQYAELKERTRSTTSLLPGTPGTLIKRTGTGRPYWYRVYQTAGGSQVEDLVGRDDDEDRLLDARAELDFAQWTATQVRNLRKLEFQVADKSVARVLVELHNKGLLAEGLVVVGTLGYMAWLNELGARAVSAKTQDIDLAARHRLKLAAPQSFLAAMQATRLGFTPVPGMPNDEPPTSVKLKGRDGLRVDVLTHGRRLGESVPVVPLMWHAQTVPHYDYLLDQPRRAAVLAGGHCVPVLLPQPERLVWHKLYASASRQSFPEKAEKDLLQAVTLAAILTEQEDETLRESLADVPVAMKGTLRKRLPAVRR